MALHCLSPPALLILWSPTAFKVGSPGHLEAAMAYVAVTMNLFGEDLYTRRGGRGKVKETHGSVLLWVMCSF